MLWFPFRSSNLGLVGVSTQSLAAVICTAAICFFQCTYGESGQQGPLDEDALIQSPKVAFFEAPSVLECSPATVNDPLTLEFDVSGASDMSTLSLGLGMTRSKAQGGLGDQPKRIFPTVPADLSVSLMLCPSGPADMQITLDLLQTADSGTGSNNPESSQTILSSATTRVQVVWNEADWQTYQDARNARLHTEIAYLNSGGEPSYPSSDESPSALWRGKLPQNVMAGTQSVYNFSRQPLVVHIFMDDLSWAALDNQRQPEGCIFSRGRSEIGGYEAVSHEELFPHALLFSCRWRTASMDGLRKRSNMVWALWCMENDGDVAIQETLVNGLDILATHRLTSDVPMVQTPRSLEYVLEIRNSFRQIPKSRGVAYITSHCGLPRDTFVSRLMDHGLQVDALGKCLHNAEFPPYDPSLPGTKKVQALAHYKVVLVFENGIGEDYMSERIWTALMAGSVPVYFGAPNAKDLLPSGSFIDASQLSVVEVLEEVQRVLQSSVAADAYMQWAQKDIWASEQRKLSALWEYSSNKSDMYGEGVQHGVAGQFDLRRLCNAIQQESSRRLDSSSAR